MAINITSSKLLLSLLVIGSVIATQPPTIFYFVTVRSFMAQICDPNRLPAFQQYCPNDPTIITRLQSGELSGHADFEANNNAGAPKLLNSMNFDRVQPYNGKYAKFGRQFPITKDGSPGTARPFVLSDLAIGTTGISTMQYCLSEEGFLCDHNGTSNRQTFNATTRIIQSIICGLDTSKISTCWQINTCLIRQLRQSRPLLGSTLRLPNTA
jgi:hypothetical protein